MFAVLATFGGVASCDKAALTAPTGSTITLFTNTTNVPITGTAQITAQVFMTGGIPVHNGTVVNFTTNIGHLDPAEVRTHDGSATTLLYPDNTSGKATVRAFSGGINSGDLALTIGAAAANKITIGSSASSVPSGGGSVTVFAVVVDADGNPVSGIPVTFTTTAGTLNPPTATTDATGRASTTLTTNATAQVTATAGTVVSSALTINAATKPVATVTATTTSPSVGQPVGFTVAVTPATNGSAQVPLRSVTINFGDGTGTQTLGTNTSQSTTHTYSSPGAFVITATATDNNGETGTGSTSIQVLPVLVSLGASTQSGAPPLTVTFTVTLTPSTVAVSSVDWDYGDGTIEAGTATLTKSHIYTRTGNWTAIATVHFVGGGTPRTASVPIRVGS